VALTGSEWWKSGVIYQIYPRSFADADGDGVGDLRGIIGGLGYLRWLGVDGVWISPFYPSPMEDFGYDISDFTGVDPLFGELADFDELVGEAHRLGIKVILDFVPNHSSHAHPWFVEARSSRDNPRRDWYIWADPKSDGSPPNNWRGITDIETEGSAWSFDERTGQYYLATFSSTQPDLNWHNPRVREAMHEALRFWLERGVDGFRIDMADHIGKDARLRDEPPPAAGADPLANATYQLNRPETFDYIRGLREVVDEYGGVAIGEIAYNSPVERLIAYHGDGDLLHLPFNFQLFTLPPEAGAIQEFVDAYEKALLAAGAWPNYSIGNHDMPRVSHYGQARARLMLMLLLTLRGTPFLYYGDEIGMPNVEVPREKRQDPFVVPQTGLSRDQARTPLQWNGGPHAGFSDAPEAEPWLPVAPDYETTNVEAESRDPKSMLSLTRALLALRKSVPALAVGDYLRYEPADGVPEDCFVYLRRPPQQGEHSAIVALNFSGGDRTVALPRNDLPRNAQLSTRLDRKGGVEGPVSLRPHEGLVLL